MKTKRRAKQRGFRIVNFVNRNGTPAFRVTGFLRGKRVRENFPTLKAAEARAHELDAERLGQQTREMLRATWLTGEQLKCAEWVFHRLPEPAEVQRAIEHWIGVGQAQADAVRDSGFLRLDEAVAKFHTHIETAVDLRPATRTNLIARTRVFVSELGDAPLAGIRPEAIEAWLATRTNVSASTRHNDLKVVRRFFSWCMARPQRFIVANPCSDVTVARPEQPEPQIFTLPEVRRLLVAARRQGGEFLKYIVLQLFGGLRPTEAARWKDEQLVDGHLTITRAQAKTGRGRTAVADPVLAAWLAICPAGAVVTPEQRPEAWRAVRRKAKLTRWITDGLRHTAISHHFRRSGSYGMTCEWAGNSEAIIKAHYQARTSAEDSTEFWTLFPTHAERARARAGERETVVAFPTAKKAGRKAGGM
jgi:integrase